MSKTPNSKFSWLQVFALFPLKIGAKSKFENSKNQNFYSSNLLFIPPKFDLKVLFIRPRPLFRNIRDAFT